MNYTVVSFVQNCLINVFNFVKQNLSLASKEWIVEKEVTYHVNLCSLKQHYLTRSPVKKVIPSIVQTVASQFDDCVQA